jgi:hypothetical protein
MAGCSEHGNKMGVLKGGITWRAVLNMGITWRAVLNMEITWRAVLNMGIKSSGSITCGFA